MNAPAAAPPVPLFVDLDGTLIATDLLLESLLLLIRRRPVEALKIPFWLARGRAHLKAQLAAATRCDVAHLPYREEFCAYLRAERAAGRKLFLATASDRLLAERVAGHLGLFDGVLASDGVENLKGLRKLAAIRAAAPAGFAYAGNSRADLPIWAAANEVVLVHAPAGIVRSVEKQGRVSRMFPRPSGAWREVIRAMRPHQWAKNVLVFVPLLTSFKLTDFDSIRHALQCFVAFSLSASATYVINDLLDLPADRLHARKRSRPLAAGRLTIPAGVAIAVVMMSAGLALAAARTHLLVAMVAFYVVTTTAYSIYLKTRVLIDVIVLASLFAFRIFAGSIAIGVVPSGWLLGFAMFIFLSLAIVKRCAELLAIESAGLAETPGRNYEPRDLAILWPMGVGSGVCSVLVSAIYIATAETPMHYGTRSLLWLVGIGLFYWLGRMWIKTSRGEMLDDPMVYAFKDFGSRVLISSMLAATLAAYYLVLTEAH